MILSEKITISERSNDIGNGKIKDSVTTVTRIFFRKVLSLNNEVLFHVGYYYISNAFSRLFLWKKIQNKM